MIVKHRKGTSFIVIGVVVVLGLSYLTIRDDYFEDYMHELTSYLIAQDPGFSDASNPSDFVTKFTRDFGSILMGKLVGFDARPSIERMDIDIKFNDFQTILSDRQRALQKTILINPTKVKAKIRFKGKTIKAKIRLKGDLIGHWRERARMSLRVELKGRNYIFGSKTFSIHKPSARQHPWDQVYQSLRKRMNGLSSNHTYARIFVNGEDWGIMNIEEHMSKEFLEKLKSRESLIVRFGNEKSWAYTRTAQKGNRVPGYRQSDEFLNIKLYNSKKYLSKDIYRKWFSYIASQRLIDDSTGLYDVDEFSRLLMLTEVWNNRHSLAHSNTRYYFNPYTLKLEPITTDQGPYYNWSKGRGGTSFDPLNYKLYQEIVSTKTFEDTFSDNLEVVSKAIKLVNEDIDYYHSFFPIDRKPRAKVLKRNLRKVLREPHNYLPVNYQKAVNEPGELVEKKISALQAATLSDHISARHYADGRIEIFNLLPTNVEILNIRSNGKVILEKNEVLKPYVRNDYRPGAIFNTSFSGLQDGKISIATRVKGHQRVFQIPYTLYRNDLYNPLLHYNPETFNFLIREDSSAWRVKPGAWEVNAPIRIKGDLAIPAGVELIFAEGTYLMVNGSLVVSGTEEAKVVLRGKDESWKGIYVYNAISQSQLNHTIISDTIALEDGLLKLTGGVTFYKSDVIFNKVVLDATKAEDALNIIHSEFKLDDITILSSISDGFDGDFSQGTITNSSFDRIGGDALDFSGSKVYITNTDIKNVVDKAISVGEASKVKVEGGYVDKVGVAFASKDGSEAFISGVTVGSVTLSVAMTYMKKAFYGSPALELEGCKVQESAEYFRQEGTELIVDGNLIEELSLDVKSLYEAGIMKK